RASKTYVPTQERGNEGKPHQGTFSYTISHRCPSVFPSRRDVTPAGNGTRFTKIASVNDRPLAVVSVPASALLVSSVRSLSRSAHDSVPVFAWTFPFAGLSGGTDFASVPSTPSTGSARSKTGYSGRFRSARSRWTVAFGVTASELAPPAPP